MIKIENVETYGWEAAIRGMRNPMNSWDKSDSWFWVRGSGLNQAWGITENVPDFTYGVHLGEKDLNLMKNLSSAGNDHGKFLRMLPVTLDITTHHAWWAEFDTYKVSTVRNSCSKMHKIHVKEFVKDDFSTEGIDAVGGEVSKHFDKTVKTLEWLRVQFNKTQEKKYWRAIIELLPMGYNIRATVMLNYAVLKNMYHARKNHKLDEWHTFCEWVETLPYSRELIVGNGI